MVEAQELHPLRLLAWCLMRNHWLFVVWPREEGEVTAHFRWLAHTHAMRWHVAHNTVGRGHLYQGRFKSFPVEEDEHFLTLCRYVERNALTAGRGSARGGLALGQPLGAALRRRKVASDPVRLARGSPAKLGCSGQRAHDGKGGGEDSGVHRKEPPVRRGGLASGASQAVGFAPHRCVPKVVRKRSGQKTSCVPVSTPARFNSARFNSARFNSSSCRAWELGVDEPIPHRPRFVADARADRPRKTSVR